MQISHEAFFLRRAVPPYGAAHKRANHGSGQEMSVAQGGEALEKGRIFQPLGFAWSAPIAERLLREGDPRRDERPLP